MKGEITVERYLAISNLKPLKIHLNFCKSLKEDIAAVPLMFVFEVCVP